MAARITSLESASAHWRAMRPKSLWRRSQTKALTGCNRPPTDGDISDAAHPPDTQYFTLVPHIKGVKAMQICQTRDPGFCSVQQHRKDQHLEKSDLGG